VPQWTIIKLLDEYRGDIDILHYIEPFIRQLYWREYSRMIYVHMYAKIKSNYFEHKNKLSQRWYTGTTGVIPVDMCIKQAFKYGYINDAMRKMVICNFMNLCNIRPKNVYKWFMEFSIDSYDWITSVCVYSMGMFADGGVATQSVQLTTSKYIIKQARRSIAGDGNWDGAWDILYYYFIYKNRHKMKGRNLVYLEQWKNMKAKKAIIKKGSKIIKLLTS
jgi:deoxyribodipyrimidine photolyase-related protein